MLLCPIFNRGLPKPVRIGCPENQLHLFAGEVPRSTIETFVGPELTRSGLPVAHPVHCSGGCFAFRGVHSFAGYRARFGLISLGVVHFPIAVGVPVLCHSRFSLKCLRIIYEGVGQASCDLEYWLPQSWPRERHSPEWRFRGRQSGDWRSRESLCYQSAFRLPPRFSSRAWRHRHG
jgi:hypothetical protein